MSVDIWLYCTNEEFKYNHDDYLPVDVIDWGDSKDTKFKLYKLNGKLLTLLLASRLIKLPNTSLIPKEIRYKYLCNNINKKLYFIYT